MALIASSKALRHIYPRISITLPIQRRQCLIPPNHSPKNGLHTSRPLQKISKTSKISPTNATIDPFDLSELEKGISKALAKLQESLSKFRPGGRFNPEILENLAVVLDKTTTSSSKKRGGGGDATMTRLGDVAQVVPRGGRSIVIHVGEKDHLKPILKTLTSSNPPSLTTTLPPPQQSPNDPLQLTIFLPSPTKESRLEAVASVQDVGRNVLDMVRNARAAQQKKLKAMFVARSVRPDDLARAEKSMEKTVEKGQKEVEEIVRGAKRALESG